jgi:hypothetical protein
MTRTTWTFAPARLHAPAVPKFSADTSVAQQSIDDHGTTLGIYSPGRPQS